MRVTQQDIAKLARVSQATVSRVLAGDDRVEAELRDRVLAAMEARNYRPDVRARSLRKRSTQLIGLVVDRQEGGLKDDPFFASLIAEITDVLIDTPYRLVVDVAADRDTARVYDDLLRCRRVDGLILVEPAIRDDRIVRLQDEGFPFVLIGNPMGAALHSFDNDNVLASRMVAMHLLDNGYQRLGFLAGPEGLLVSDDRVTGYRLAVRERGLPELVWHAGFGLKSAARVAGDILNSPNRPDALVVLDDFMAMGVVQACAEQRMSIPDDFGLASFNDTSLCGLLEGGLTSVNLSIDQLVRSAVTRLLCVIEDDPKPEPSRQIVPCELKVRGSTRGRWRARL